MDLDRSNIYDKKVGVKVGSRKNQMVMLWAMLTFVIGVLLYGMWLPYSYSGDDLQYAASINQAVTEEIFYHPAGYHFYNPHSGGAQIISPVLSDTLINPRYAFEWPTSIIVAKLWKYLGWNGDIIIPLLTLRVLVGALGIIFFFLALQSLCNDTLIAGISSIGLLTSHAYWYYSTHLDYTINMTTVVCSALYLAVLQYKFGNRPHINFIFPVVLAVATLYSWTAGMTFFVFVLAATFWHPDEKIRDRIRQLISFCAVYGILIIVVIPIMVAVWVSPLSVVSSDYWKSVIYVGRPDYNFNIANDAIQSALGFAKGQIAQAEWIKLSRRHFYGLIFILMSTPFWVLLFKWRQLQRKTWVWMLLILAWLIAYGAFNLVWNPAYIKYWTVPLIAWWTVVALTLEHLKLNHLGQYRLAVILVLFLIGSTFFVNLTTEFLPKSDERSNEWLVIAQSLKRVKQNVLFVSTGQTLIHPLDWHIAYFAVAQKSAGK